MTWRWNEPKLALAPDEPWACSIDSTCRPHVSSRAWWKLSAAQSPDVLGSGPTTIALPSRRPSPESMGPHAERDVRSKRGADHAFLEASMPSLTRGEGRSTPPR